MIEKRFEVDWEDDELCNIFDNEIVSHISVEEVCDLLNALHEENQLLKKALAESSKTTIEMLLQKDDENVFKFE